MEVPGPKTLTPPPHTPHPFVTHCHCRRGNGWPRGCAGRGCRWLGAASASPSSCWKETRGEVGAGGTTRERMSRRGVGGTQQAPGAAASPRHNPPEAGGVLQPGDLQAAQRLRHVPGAQREALELGGRNQVETCGVWGGRGASGTSPPKGERDLGAARPPGGGPSPWPCLVKTQEAMPLMSSLRMQP